MSFSTSSPTTRTGAAHTAGHHRGASSRVATTRRPLSGSDNAPCRSVVVRASALDTILKPITSLGRVPGDLKRGIASFYDESSALWEDMWGEHMHHGYYPRDGPRPRSHQQAQVDLVDVTLDWAGVQGVRSALDVGCGIGGSSRHIVRRWPGAKAQGITLSPNQAKRANELTAQAGLSEFASFQVADALAQPFADDSFDLVWSMESAEHMPDKKQFVNEVARVCAPGGKIIVVTWCHRDLAPGESLRPEEQSLLERINEAYYLPQWCSAADYKHLMGEAGLTGIRSVDWSEEVSPFWGAVIETAMTGAGLAGLFKAGWTTIKGALVMPLMAQGFKWGTIKFQLITAIKP